MTSWNCERGIIKKQSSKGMSPFDTATRVSPQSHTASSYTIALWRGTKYSNEFWYSHGRNL